MSRRRGLGPAYGVLVAISALLAALVYTWLGRDGEAAAAELGWMNPYALLLLLGGAVLAAWVSLHLGLARAPVVAHSRVSLLGGLARGPVARLALLPEVLRIAVLALMAIALARPYTYRTETLEVLGIDIMVVLDLSKSMEERDLEPDRLGAGQQTIRRFLASRDGDRVGLVVFAQAAMMQCPLTIDYRVLDAIVADLAIGDVPEMGTAIGDALALALASLRRSDARSKVVILISDGDSNVSEQLSPEEARDLAVDMGVRVFTILVGKDPRDPGGPGGQSSGGQDGTGALALSGRYSVNPMLLGELAAATGGHYFRAGDGAALEHSFERVRQTLDKDRRRVVGRVPGGELFTGLLAPALGLLGLELLLRLTRWRRFP